MGSGNLKRQLIKKMTAKQMARVSIIEERHNLCQELAIITGEEVARRPVPDWRWSGDKPKNDRECNHSKSNTLDKSKSINDDFEESKKGFKGKKKTQRSVSQKTLPKKNKMIASLPKKKRLHLNEELTKPKINSKKENTIKGVYKQNSLPKFYTPKINSNPCSTMLVNLSKKPKTLQIIKMPLSLKQTKNCLLSKNNLLHLALLAKIRKNIKEGKQFREKDNSIFNETHSEPINRRLSIGQPDDSDYEYEY